MEKREAFQSTESFLEGLLAPGPAAHGGTSDLYSGLIGAWDAEVVDHRPDGTTRRQSAEIQFSWVLEGRAIQDLWIAPARRDRLGTAAKDGGNRYGTTLRVYDADLDVWRITWINPVTGVEMRLVGRRVGSGIVQTGADAQGRLVRWVFTEILPESFHWVGQLSEDGGETWVTQTEFFAHRRL